MPDAYCTLECPTDFVIFLLSPLLLITLIFPMSTCDTVNNIYEATINSFTVIKSIVIHCRRHPDGECNFRSFHLNFMLAD
jgi:hypothetical protein